MKLRQLDSLTLPWKSWLIMVGFIFRILLLLLCSDSSGMMIYASSSPSTTRRFGGVHPRRSTSSSSSSSSSIRRNNDGLCRNGGGAFRSCRFFLWDGISAIQYHTCKYLMRDRIYEGLGGKKFVRIKPGSILEYLYPLSKHSPNRCMLCGNSYDQHLATWWFPQLYSPYDLHLDRVFQSATANSSSQNNNNERKRKQKNISSSSKRNNPNVKKRKIIDKQHENEEEKEPPDMKPMLHGSFKHFPVLNYHKAYVRLVDEDDDDISERQPSKGNTNRKLQPKPRHVKKEHTPNVQYRTRTSIDDIKYKYRIAKIPEKYKGENELVFLLLVARRMVLYHVEDLLFLEQKENSFYERKRWNPFGY